ncbi:MAG: cytochrome c peroxidase [Planctomycetota bacterium]
MSRLTRTNAAIASMVLLLGIATLTRALDVRSLSLPLRSVTLGDPSLTAGIPGDGPLTDEQIEAWLADPANHQPLRPKLPLGLATDAANISGVAENPLTRAKIELGRQLYFDKRLSGDGTVSCASCHAPTHGYSFDTRLAVGIGEKQGTRHSPVSYNRILSRHQFWDGRAGSLEEQSLGPIASPIEMGNTHENVVATLDGIQGYRQQFQRIFADGVTIENVGKAIATFERVLVTGPSPWDHYERLKQFEKVYEADLEEMDLFREEDPELAEYYDELQAAADANPMSDPAKRGAALFFSQQAGCSQCHAGANFSDELYHNLGIGYDRPKGEPDAGRFAVTGEDEDRGAFKTPTLRNVALTAPYMHDGSLNTLHDVVDFYWRGGHINPHQDEKIGLLDLSGIDQAELVEFLRSLTGKFPTVETGRLPQ